MMTAGMVEVLPVAPVAVACAAMRRWSKDAEPVFDGQNRLVAWEPPAPSA